MVDLKTTVIGSYPKYPPLVNGEFDVRWLISPGNNLDKGWRNKENLEKLQNKAIRWAVKEQEETGLDVITDGEQKRGNFVFYHCQHLDGFDFDNKETKLIRGKSRTELVPVIRGPIRHKEFFLLDEFYFLKFLTNKQIKVTIPGPSTIMDSVKDLYYNDEKEVVLDLAKAIRKEVNELSSAGCDIIQFDEPVFVREPEKFFEYGITALQDCFKGVGGIEKVVHICRGYPSKEKDVKAQKNNYGKIIEALSSSTIDRIAVEDGHEHLDLEIFKKFRDKEVVLGAVDIGNEQIEKVEEIRSRIIKVLEIVPPEKLFIAPDCGLLLLDPEVAKAKLKNLVKAAKGIG